MLLALIQLEHLLILSTIQLNVKYIVLYTKHTSCCKIHYSLSILNSHRVFHDSFKKYYS